jgi:hypothetical protein
MVSGQPQKLGVSSAPPNTHFSLTPTHHIPCTNLRNSKVLEGSFQQVAREKGLATPNLTPSRSALTVGFGQIQVGRPHPSIDSDVSPEAQVKRTIIECSADAKRPTS